MPSLSLPNAGTFKRGVTTLSLAISFALTGCGSETPTTRVSETETPEIPPYTIYVRSPVQFKHVQYRILNASTGVELVKKTVSDASDLVEMTIPAVNFPTQTLLLIEVSASNTNATYFDPILKKDTAFPLSKKLHALVINSRINTSTYKVDPFSELAYRRSLYRTGQLDASHIEQPNYNLINSQSINYSNAEIESIFQVQPTAYGLSFADIAKLKRNSQSVRAFTDLLFSVGHVKNYATQFNDQTAPWFGFIDLVSRDISDGDLDGMTLAGVGDEGAFSDQLATNQKLALEASVPNTNPEHNTIAILAENQKNQRTVFNKNLGTVITSYFDAFFTASSDEYKFIHSVNYEQLKTEGGNPLASTSFGLRSAGAGNFTRAFGLFGDTLSKNALTSDINSSGTNLSTNVNDLEQLVGRYRNGSCTLDLSLTGRVTLSNGSRTVESTINRDLQDNMFRANNTSTTYTVNIGKPSDNTFIQLQIANVNATDKTPLRLVSATAGSSLLDQPDQLSPIDFSCSF